MIRNHILELRGVPQGGQRTPNGRSVSVAREAEVGHKARPSPGPRFPKCPVHP